MKDVKKVLFCAVFCIVLYTITWGTIFLSLGSEIIPVMKLKGDMELSWIVLDLIVLTLMSIFLFAAIGTYIFEELFE